MSIEKVVAYLKNFGMEDRVRVFDVSSATVELAAKALDCDPGHIAKTMSFQVGEKVILVVAAGNVKIDNRKFKDCFNVKASMLPRELVGEKTGHPAGGVCPFAVLESVDIYLDISLKNFDVVYPAAGSDNSAVRISPEELEKICRPVSWVDVCKLTEEKIEHL